MGHTPIFYRGVNNYDTTEASDEATIKDRGESLTIQSQSEDADINVMMRRYGVTGKMPENPRVPTYGDFTGINDYRSAVEAVNNAEDSFMELTADVRARFNNNPQALLEFMSKDENADEAERLGLFSQEAVKRRSAERAAKSAAEATAARKAAEQAPPASPAPAPST